MAQEVSDYNNGHWSHFFHLIWHVGNKRRYTQGIPWALVLSMVSAAAVGWWLMLPQMHCFKREGIVHLVLMACGPLAGWLALVHFGNSVKKMVDESMIFKSTFLGVRFVLHSRAGYLFKDNIVRF